MTFEKPTAGLTIVVLTHNRRNLLRGCMESLFTQDDPGIPLQFVVVDDGSTDGSDDMVHRLITDRPQWHYIRQEHKGIAAARNTGIRSSRSAWIAIVADDYLLPVDYARSVADFFLEHPDAQVVRFKVEAAGGGFLNRILHAYHEASVLRRLAAFQSGRSRRGLWRRQQAPGRTTISHDLEAAGAAAFRSEVFQQVGVFNESFSRGEDTEFTRRLRAAGIPVHFSPHVSIAHCYDANLGATLKNTFSSGRASWRLHAALRQKPVTIAAVIRLGLRTGPAVFYWSCWRAWQAGWPARFFLYLPVLMLLEASSRAGFFSGCILSRKKSTTAFGGCLPL